MGFVFFCQDQISHVYYKNTKFYWWKQTGNGYKMQNTCWMGEEVTKFKYRTGRGMAYNSMWHSSDKGLLISVFLSLFSVIARQPQLIVQNPRKITESFNVWIGFFRVAHLAFIWVSFEILPRAAGEAASAACLSSFDQIKSRHNLPSEFKHRMMGSKNCNG